MNYFILELNDEVYKLRLTSADCIEIEKSKNTKMLDYIRDYSHTTIATLLRYLCKSDRPNFSMNNACELMDKLIDNGYTLERILYDVIYEALVVSGFLTKAELEEVKNTSAKALEKNKEKIQEALQN